MGNDSNIDLLVSQYSILTSEITHDIGRLKTADPGMNFFIIKIKLGFNKKS